MTLNFSIWAYFCAQSGSPEHARLQTQRQLMPPTHKNVKQSIRIFISSLLQCSTRNQVGRNLESSENHTVSAAIHAFERVEHNSISCESTIVSEYVVLGKPAQVSFIINSYYVTFAFLAKENLLFTIICCMTTLNGL